MSGTVTTSALRLDVEPLEKELTHLDRELRLTTRRLRSAHADSGPTAVRAAVVRGDLRRLAARRNQLDYAISRLTSLDAT